MTLPDHVYDMLDAAPCHDCAMLGALCEVHLRQHVAELRRNLCEAVKWIRALRELADLSPSGLVSASVSAWATDVLSSIDQESQ